MLVPAQYSGRVDDPLEAITEGTTEGDLVFGMIRHNQHLFFPDLNASPPPGWPSAVPHGRRRPGSRHLYAGHHLASNPGNRQAHPGALCAPRFRCHLS